MEVLIPQSLTPLGELDRKKYSEERENTKSLFKSHKNAWEVFSKESFYISVVFFSVTFNISFKYINNINILNFNFTVSIYIILPAESSPVPKYLFQVLKRVCACCPDFQ